MSIFDNTFVEPGWECTYASKNVSRGDSLNNVIVSLIYRRGEQMAEVSASYTTQPSGKICMDLPAAVLIRQYDHVLDQDPAFRRKMKAYRPEDVTPTMIADLNAVNHMFDLADSAVRRVYL